jgi:hypothetical protein
VSAFRFTRCARTPTIDVESVSAQGEGDRVNVKARIGSPAVDGQIAAEVAQVLDRRGSLKHPPVSLAVSDAVAIAIAGLFKNSSQSGQVLDRFYRTGLADHAELIEAVKVEQVFASPEGHAALYCLIGWVRAQVHALAE